HEAICRIEQASPGRARALLLAFVRQEVADVLGLDTEALAVDAGFFQLGMDSLMSVSLRNRLQKSMATSLPSTLAFEHPSVAELAEYIASEVLHIHGAAQELAPDDARAEADPAEPPSRFDERALDDLSEEQLAALVAEELSSSLAPMNEP
ncbi:MAG TPA: acyl carrier protein, partial [Polyangiaceae bacterium]|nr:acyl carrier protein [Polyangiaceae bacterium]